MAVERRATCGHWYARFRVNGKRVCVALETPVEGVPGSPEFEESRKRAREEETALRGSVERRDAEFHRRMAAA